MASIDSIVDAFITENGLDAAKIKLPLQGLVNKCFEGVFKHIYNAPIPETGSSSKPKAQKVLKADRIEDPATCETRDELLHCTTAALAAYCKKRSLKVGGNKTDVVDRVWRDIQGTGSEEDKSPRNKAKATKKVAEKHQCSGCNAKGEMCAVVGTECFPDTDYWFCWRHIVDAAEFVAKLDDPNQPKPKERAPKPPKAAKAEAKPKKKSKAKAESELESESETEPEPVKKKSSKPKAKAPAKATGLFEDSDSEPEEEAPKPKKKASKPKAEEAPKPKLSKKKIPEPETESESEEDVSDQDSEAERKEYYAKLSKEAFELEEEELEM
jgi:ribosomal protein L44E